MISDSAISARADDDYEYRIIQNNPVESGALAAKKTNINKNFPINANTQLGVKKDSFSNPFAVSPSGSTHDLDGVSTGMYLVYCNFAYIFVFVAFVFVYMTYRLLLLLYFSLKVSLMLLQLVLQA